MAIRRTLPRSSNSRFNALTAAEQKKDNTATASQRTTAATNTRLDNIYTQFTAARNTLSIKQAESVLPPAKKLQKKLPLKSPILYSY